MKKDWAIVVSLGILLLGFTAVFTLFPRSDHSELEKRDLAKFPDFSWSKLLDGSYTTEISAWFSDSEPFRDELMSFSMTIREAERWPHFGSDDRVSFHGGSTANEEDEPEDILSDASLDADSLHPSDVDAKAKVANAGIIVVGEAPKVRALMAFKGTEKRIEGYARIVNRYKELFDVRIYCMVIPTSVEFYCPEKVRSLSQPEVPVLNHLNELLADSVKYIPLFGLLEQHKREPIFLRTDHHWAPLGAYYAARQFADSAGVKRPNIKDFDQHVVPGFVGSMYGYAQDKSIKQSPEDFVYYTPRLPYQTYFTVFKLNEEFEIVEAREETKGDFFVEEQVSTGNAYCTFMGSDSRITRVETSSINNGRKLLIFKDSFGNALPGYLMGSFEEIHVIDFRYFPYSISDYISEHEITDILFCNNISHACTQSVVQAYKRFLTQ